MMGESVLGDYSVDHTKFEWFIRIYFVWKTWIWTFLSYRSHSNRKKIPFLLTVWDTSIHPNCGRLSINREISRLEADLLWSHWGSRYKQMIAANQLRETLCYIEAMEEFSVISYLIDITWFLNKTRIWIYWIVFFSVLRITLKKRSPWTYECSCVSFLFVVVEMIESRWTQSGRAAPFNVVIYEQLNIQFISNISLRLRKYFVDYLWGEFIDSHSVFYLDSE